ncbi:FAD-dependent oxidoreductase [Propionicimonas sp.]|uniref:oxidoreductase n=1 Tax=Propionicimonas sp. TaxID=1955623 RepID=UPI0039E69120
MPLVRANGALTYPHLFSPLTVRGVTFRNRVFGSPITTNRIVENGYPTPEGIDFYEARSRGGFAQVTLTEAFVDDEFSRRHEHGLDLYSRQLSTIHAEAILTLTEAITAHGAVASIQLNHVGGVNHPNAIKGHLNPIGPSSSVRPDGVRVDAMDEAMMERVASHFAEAALMCRKLGFGMVMLHGGHGWLLSQFVSPLSNHRTDRYGGSLENRARFPLMVIDRVRDAVGEDFPIEFRISGDERTPGGMELPETVEYCRMLESHVDLIHVTSGLYFNHVESKAFSSMFDAHGCNLDLAAAVRAAVSVPVVAVGGFNDPQQIEDAIAAGQCDAVALGRQQFADPEFVNKAAAGRADEIYPCLRCSCFNPLMADPESRPVPPLWSCTVNPWASRELRWRTAPRPLGRRRVLVVGAGPGGLFAALTAAERGHDVTVWEKSDTLGGTLWFTDRDLHKESLRRYKDALAVRCRRLGVTIETGHEATPEDIREFGADRTIIAVGAQAAVPPIPGIDHAHHTMWAYQNPDLLGRRVVMVGGGLIGCESSLLFAEQGHQVTILEALPELAKEANDSHRRALLPRLATALTAVTGARVLQIRPDGVVYADASGEHAIEADTVLFATGSRPRTALARRLAGGSPQAVTIGDCNAARRVEQATYEGFCAAMDVI